MSRRETWAKTIFDTNSAGRYLLPGSDVEFRPTFVDGGEADVQAFLERLDDHGGSVELLASAYWLSQPSVDTFFLVDLPALLKNLGHGSRTSPASIVPTFKGQVLWQETVLGRLSGGVPRGRYLVKHIEKSADIPENRLLKMFLSKVLGATTEMTRRGTGALPRRISQIRDAAARGLANTYVQSVEIEHRVTARMLATSRRHRDARYSRLADHAINFDRAITRGKWAQIIDLLTKGWLAPISSEDLFELYALILVMQVIEKDLGFGAPHIYGLIQRDRAAVAVFLHPTTAAKAEVFFDQVPGGIFGTSSEYLQLVASHEGVVGQARRPDIIVKLSTERVERRLLVEVKESEDPGYIRDSIYKVLAYLRDFSELWAGPTRQQPKALLIFPTGVAPVGPLADLALVSTDRIGDIASALRAALDVPDVAASAE